MKIFLTISLFIPLFLGNIYSEEWKFFELNRPIYDVISKGDYLWGLTENDLIRIDKITGERKYYDNSNCGIENYDYDTRMVLDSSGNLWFSYSYTNDIGLSRYGITKYNIETNEWTTYSEGLYPYQHGMYFTGPLAVDSKGQLWIYMRKNENNNKGGLAIFKEEETEIIKLDSCEEVNDFFIDKNDNIWFTIENKICRYDGINLNKFYPYHDSPEFKGISSLSIDKNGNLWFSDNENLYKYDYLSRNLYNISVTISESHWDNIYNIFCDSNDIIWILTDIGIFSFNGFEFIEHDLFKNDFSAFDGKYIPNNNIFGFLEDDNGIIWSYFNNSRIVYYDSKMYIDLDNPEITYPFPEISSLVFDSKNNAYFTSEKKLIKYSNNEFQEYSYYKDLNKITIDKEDNLWITNKNNTHIALFDGIEFHIIDIPIEYHWSKDYHTIIKSDNYGNTWVSVGCIEWFGNYLGIEYKKYYGDGIYMINKNKVIRHYKSELPQDFISDFVIDNDGSIWAICSNFTIQRDFGLYTTSSFSGLTHLDGTNIEIIDTLNTKLLSNLVHNLALAPDGTLWMSCIKISKNTFSDYSYDDKLPSINSEMSLGLIKYDKDKSMEIFDAILNNEMPSNHIINISIDNNNRAWVLFQYNDLVCISKNKIHKFSELYLSHSSIPKFDSKGNTWIINGIRNLYKISSDFHVKSFDLEELNIQDYYNKIEIDNYDNIWIYGSKISIYNEDNILLSENEDNEIRLCNLSIHPNPFSQSTTINYEIREAGHISLELFDMLGNRVATIIDNWQEAGKHQAVFNVRNTYAVFNVGNTHACSLPAGMYLLKMTTGDGVVTEKVVYVE